MNLVQQDWANGLKNDSEEAVILDVRTEDEYNEGFIRGAINLDIYKGQCFIYNLEELDKTKKYYVYCRSGARSQQACSIMNEMGFPNAFNLMGGILDWQGEVTKAE